MNYEEYMEAALKEAKKSLAYSDVPIGAVIVYRDEIIGKGYNKVEQTKNPLAHAEIIAIQNAIKKYGHKHLYDTQLYVTLEPCSMCAGAIVLARIKTVYIGAEDPKTGACGSLYNIINNTKLNHRCEVFTGILEVQCSNLIKDFFKQVRNSKNVD